MSELMYESKSKLREDFKSFQNMFLLNRRKTMLLNEAMKSLKTEKLVYEFFHYFGMNCFARHGKLFEKHTHIEYLLKENGFEIEHENVYYSSAIKGNESSEVVITANNLTKGNQQYIEFKIDDNHIGDY
ncbi:MAG: hypothetical protein UH241_03370 [Acutalibacteraceae bacterium]|nr:hypothetical protein [Acutalibacteraceae bacterium]